MNSLVVYFSKTGNTRFVAEEIAMAASADVEEIQEVDSSKREGILGWLRAGRDGMLKKKSAIQATTKKANVDWHPTYYTNRLQLGHVLLREKNQIKNVGKLG